MLPAVILTAAAILLAALLWFERWPHSAGRVLAKTGLSSLFVLTAVLQPHAIRNYYFLILIALIFCLGGDVFLALPREKTFLGGLLLFLLGHVFYCFAFFTAVALNGWTLAGLVATAMAGVVVYHWLQPNLGSLKIPVILYIVVISVMVVGAVTVCGQPSFDPPGRWLVLSGALSFYVSDLFVARNRFMKIEFTNRLLGLPLYYTGQFCLAFSIGVLHP